MPAVKTKRISTLIESQLPEFISTEYELFSKFVQKYYEAQEVQGGTLDVINNIQKYADIDYYEKNLLKQNDILASSVSDSDVTIVLNDARSFPKKNGYVKIDDEIIFYATRTNTELRNCSRGVSGNTTLGDLYAASNFTSTEAAAHNSGQKVHNISNLFLYAFVKNFETQYLGSFPEKYLKGEIDKRTLIKNIQKFYKAKGTDSSIKFVFNTIVAKEIDNKPEVYKPRDFTYKSSESDWVNVHALKVKVVSGDPKTLVGQTIVQEATDEYGYASAVVDNTFASGTSDGEEIYNIVLAPETINGSFGVSTKTKLESTLLAGDSAGKRINVFSTVGWDSVGTILIDDEVIEFDDKTVNQFILKARGDNPQTYVAGESVYRPVTLKSGNVTLLSMGIVYNLSPSDSHPYAYPGDNIEVSQPGFETADPKIVRSGTNQARWLFSTGNVSSSSLPYVASDLSEVKTNVSAIFEDEQYYYITSSSFPSYDILDGSNVTSPVQDQKLLRLIRKVATRTTESYETPKRDSGILVNGVPIYSHKDSDSVRYGKLEKIDINTRGSGYTKAPFVLVDDVPYKARAILSGQVVERIVVDTNDIFTRTPIVKITSGRRADVRAIVTRGKVTSLVIDNPGEYYSEAPIVRITDTAGKGRFANYEAVVDANGKLESFNLIAEGNFYSQDTVKVDIIPIGSGATGIPSLKEWTFNRYEKLNLKLDTNNGYLFENYNNVLEYGYGHIGNPKSLRVALNDNINSAGTEPSTKTHSPIIGFAYDGNPIYGPFGHEDPLDSNSSIVRMTSGYSLNGSRTDGPSTGEYRLGLFTNDYSYTHKSGTLDENNGRFCITPDFPKGTYAYFLTIDSNQVPQYPYFIGQNYYSLPVDSNYNSNINQNDIPKNAKRYYIPGMSRNGEGLIASVSEVSAGNVDNVGVVSSSTNFSKNSKIYFDNRGTDGSEVEANVSAVKGKSVSYLQSKENKVVQLTTIQNAYLFVDDTLTQPSSSAQGTIVGTVANDNVIVLKDVQGTFDSTGTFASAIETYSLLLDAESSYTEGVELELTNGIDPAIATAEVLEGTSGQNLVKIKVLSGDWEATNYDYEDYFIQSKNLFDTTGSRIVTNTPLSKGLEPFIVNQSVALIETGSNHGLGIGDKVTIDINPDDTTKTKTYYLRKRLYQEISLISPTKETTINDTGIGRYEILNGGADYTPGTYTNISLTGGSGTGATATFIVSNAGLVSSIQIQDSGTGYARGDYLSVDDADLVRSGASQSTARFTVYIGHVGFAAESTSLTVDDPLDYAVNDLITIGEEVLKIVAINGSTFTVDRAQEGSSAIDHFDGQKVILKNGRYNFITDREIFPTNNTGTIVSYDPVTQKIVISYDYSTTKLNADEVILSSNFFDNSTPARGVRINTVSDLVFKFEFSEDNVNFSVNPNLNIQEYYKYVFDTSHSSLSGTYFDISPSINLNLVTVEKTESTILPGTTGSFTDVKFGFGSRLADNNYQTKVRTDFSKFYYFDQKNIVDSENSFFSIITDPLQGTKDVTYVTPNRFVYQIDSTPLWDGSGTITYTTTGQFAIGGIHEVAITNSGLNYKKPPIIVGADPTESYRASATALFDLDSKVITGVNITEKGSNYVNPKVVITNGDGVDAEFNIVVRNGEIFSVTVKNAGRGYTFAPDIEIVESQIDLNAEGSSIGVPRTVSIVRNGGAYHLDNTVASTFTSNYVFSLTNYNGEFLRGEKVVQKINNVEVMTGVVTEWRKGSNLLKVKSVTGIIRENQSIEGIVSKTSGTISKVFVTDFATDIRSFYDNLGFYTSDKGKLGVSNQKLTDSFFYQDYSYVVKSKTSIEEWRDLIKSTTHPAGFKLFGQVDIETSASAEMEAELPKASHFTVIQLWDPNKNKITVENTRRTITQSVQTVENHRIRKGQGSAAISEFNFNETRAFEFRIYNNTPGFYDATTNPPNPADAKPWWTKNPFDGYIDTDGRLQGSTNFQLRTKTPDTAFTPVDVNSLIVSLNGILQEPGVAYTISGDNIVFSKPPLGDNTKLTGSNGETTPYGGVVFYGKYFAFKDSQYNTKYLKKIRNIFQRGGTWIDAANQIERNKQFIIEETIGYAVQAYPNLNWSVRQDEYETDIGFILDALSHDVRFGGNVKSVDYTNILNGGGTDYLHIANYKTESIAMFKYATRLAKLAIRNWDYTDVGVSYFAGSFQMTVSNTENLTVGMFVSSGRTYPVGTKIVSIDSETQVTLNNAALANSAGGGGAPVGTTLLSGTGTTGPIPTNTGAIAPGNTFNLPPGVIVTIPTAFSGTDIATFSLSNINNGTFYDAANLIASNRADIISQSLTWAQTTYPGLNWGSLSTKCGRDIGLFIDAYVYHLKYGGNYKIVEGAQLYWTKADYPYGEQLYYISGQLTETIATLAKARDLAILAMKNLGAVTDPNVVVDSVSPICAEVESTLNTYHDIVNTVLTVGRGVVPKTKENLNRSGYYTSTLTYSNNTILPDPGLSGPPYTECVTVISSVDSLFGNIKNILEGQNINPTLPDYIDGETKEFELYWEDNSDVNLEEDEDLFLTLNAVLQRPKYTETYPLEDAYYIDRSVIPNIIKFDVPPIWDQDLGAKTIGEPTAVEKVAGIGVGNYKRLTIQPDLVDGIKSGPFIILDLEDNTVQSIDDSAYLYVFVDGILQREGFSYEISGPNIFFKFPVKPEMKIDMRYLYGRDVGQILNIYDFAPDTYFATANISLNTTAGANTFVFDRTGWMGIYQGLPIHAYQVRPDGTKNVIGEILNYSLSGNTLDLEVFGSKVELIQGTDVTFVVKGHYNVSTIVSLDASGSTVTYDLDSEGRLSLKDSINSNWANTSWGKTYKKPFISLSNDDQVRIEGEESFRKIKKLPTITSSKEQRPQQPVNNSLFGTVEVSAYSGVIRGEGLSVIAEIQNGSVISLTWNRRNYEPVTQPTAYQYFTPPVLHFVPENGEGGGAIAEVIVSKGQVVAVELIAGGSGYTKAPKVVVARRFDVLNNRDIGVSIINVGINPQIETAGMTTVSTIDILGNRLTDISSFSSVDLLSPADTDRVIRAEIQTGATGLPTSNLVGSGSDMPVDSEQPGGAQIVYIEPEPVEIEGVGGALRLQDSVSVLNAQIQDIASLNSITNTSRVITTEVTGVINNTALSNVNYFEVGAFLDIELDVTDYVIFISDSAMPRFKPQGYLMVGDEIIRYEDTMFDRFIYIHRGELGTTPKTWPQGTFLRQIPDPVSVVFGGATSITSDSELVTLSVGVADGRPVEKRRQFQVTTPVPDMDVTKVERQIELIPPGTGVVDRYQESAFIVDPLKIRAGNTTGGHDGEVDLIEVPLLGYPVITRAGNTIYARNRKFSAFNAYIGTYEITNVGHRIKSFDILMDDGSADVSGISLFEIGIYFPSLTIGDFTERAESSYTKAGDYFNLDKPSVQNPVTISSTQGTIGGNIVVPSTAYFPASGYIFHAAVSGSPNFGVIKYTSKTATTFEGCTVYNGSTTIVSGAEIVPFTID